MAASKTIIISVPRFQKVQAVGIPTETECSRITPNASFVMDSRVACISTWEDIDENSTDSSCLDPVKSSRGKKRKLNHLTYEEKLQRKKLKNRVAAQCSRDRKKARMDELEAEVKELSNKCEVLSQRCEQLLARNQALELENRSLRKVQQRPQTRDVGCSPTSGPAASPADPLPWGPGTAAGSGPEGDAPADLLSSFPDLLSDVDEDYLAQLDQLVETLLQDVANTEGERHQQAPSAFDDSEARTVSHPVVGQASEVLEPCRVSYGDVEMVGLEEALVPEVSHTVEVEDESVIVEDVVQEEDSSYHVPQITIAPCSHTYTHSSNTREASLSQPSSPLLYSPSSGDRKSLSVLDSGYESVDSPHRDNDEVLDFWSESFVELFPSLV